MDVLDQQLGKHPFIAGDEYSIADMATWPWYGALVMGKAYDAGEFLQADSYKHLLRWAKKIAERPSVARGSIVNRTWGPESEQLAERHSAADFPPHLTG